MMLNKNWCKVAACFRYIPLFSSDIPSDFQELIGVVLLKYLFYFLAGINTK